MTTLKEGRLAHSFPAGWVAAKYDDWAFYRNQFAGACGGNKAVDLVAVDPLGATLWLVEIKDYRRYRRGKAVAMPLEVALKVRDTLAGLLAAKSRAVGPEKFVSNRSASADRIRIVFHLEQPATHSRLFPRVFDRAVVQQAIRRLVKPIDPHPLVVELAAMGGIPWTAASA